MYKYVLYYRIIMRLNYHHLRYFQAVAHDGTLTHAARALNVSQSALSTQIAALEDRLGHALFDRVGRRLELTEVGRIVLDHADRIFRIGNDLGAVLERTGDAVPPLRVGAASTLSRNFQLRFLAPVLDGASDVVLRSGEAAALLHGLRSHALDVVLLSEPPRGGDADDLAAHPLARDPVGLHGRPDLLVADTLRDLLARGRFILPSEAGIRTGFAALADRLGAVPRIVADVDDMAMVRLLVRQGVGIAVSPAVVVADELANGRLATAPFALDLALRFYAVTLRRAFPHPLLSGLLSGESTAGETPFISL